ncbi:acyl transferase domain-containing protein [Krasilnikovia cinnamomea]|uniref:Acyl transferase domain-containing protein n=1 Tax=Krasilnikovia cinnamomea TaxID=349313 RepID=A0A4Q7ZL38_9ACTN|nr:type I polyketide synthase [Krasilnikovia cinnamomea]RZU51657.1 acyl transferase domain-containing protein [Krasilnikovia cinnamomea]
MSLEPVAIIGIAARVPDAADVEQFWENLLAGRESIHRLTDEELLANGEDPRLLADPRYVRARPLLDEVDGFDHRYFGVSAREAELRNPQHRLFLELCATALQNGGYDAGAYDGAVGVYGAAAYDRYAEDHIRADPKLLDQVGEMVANVSNNIDYLSTYVSFRLNLRGPSLSVRTACSSSLVALHLACQAIRQGECDMALAGGVEIEMPYGRGYVHVEGGIDARDGHCRPLDADATGTVFGSGGGVVLLKALAEAVADGDQIHAVILGSALSNDGAERQGFTAPSSDGQGRAVGEALMVSGVDPADVSYVELHGTGTVLGDPIEVHGLDQAFRSMASGDLPAGNCLIGSVKANIGHLGPASGVVGLIKTALALRNELIPRTINVTSPNPALELGRTPFRIADSVVPWPRVAGSPRRAGVSSFGFGGTNAHVIVQEAPEPAPRPAPDEPRSELLVWSAVDAATEPIVRARLAAALAQAPADAAPDIAFTSQLGRKPLPVRGALRFTDPATAATALGDAAAVTALGDGTRRAPVLLFPGQGAQHPQAAVRLADTWPAFGRRVHEHLSAFGDLLGIDLPRVWRDELDARTVSQTVHAQPLLFAIGYALAESLAELGVQPTAVTGHSVGELVAATVAGVFTPADARLIVARRAQLMADLPPGRMLAVAAPEDRVRPLLIPGVAVSAVNSVRQLVVGGAPAAIEAFRDVLDGQGLGYRELATSHAFHTPAMEPAIAELTSVIKECELRVPEVPLVSAAAGALLDGARALDPEFWARQLTAPVRFLDALRVLATEPAGLLVEAGPGATLTSLARQETTIRQAGHRSVGVLGRGAGRDDWDCFQDTLAELWAGGAPLDWTQVPRAGEPRRVSLPTYPYQRRRFWLPTPDAPAPTRTPDVATATVTSADLAAAPVAAAAPASSEPVVVLPGWRPDAVVLGAPVGAPRRGTAVVVLPENANQAQTVLGAVQRAGYRPLAVTFGDTSDLRPHRCVVRPDAGGLDALFAFLRDRDVVPELLVHARCLDPVSGDLPPDDPSLMDATFWSPLELFQAAARARDTGLRQAPLVVVAKSAVDATAAEGVVPARAAVTGLVRSIALEAGTARIRMIDIRGVTEAVLATELTSAATEPVVALRGNRRWLPDRTRLRPDGPSPAALVRRGVYLITGGLGALGLAAAQGLADTGLRPRLVLLGRRADDPATVEAVQGELDALAAAGAEIQLVAADVADAEAMRAVAADLVTRHGTIDGILHAAGVPGAGLAERRSRDGIAQVLRPKVTGSVVLRDLARSLPGVRFLVFFSSRAALNGLVGSADYAAANAYQDALAMSDADPELLTLSVNWPAWRNTGMAALGGVPAASPGVRWSQLLHPTDWLVAEHVVDGRPTVPGTAYIDLLARAVRAQPGINALDPLVIEDLTLSAPLAPSGPVEVTVGLTPAAGGWRAFVESRPKDSGTGRTVRHATATVTVDADLERPTADPDGPAEDVPPGEGARAGTTTTQFDFGPHFDCVDSVRRLADDPDVLLADLVLPEEFEDEVETFTAHPALVDRALALRLTPGGQVPFTCRRIVLYGDLPGRVTARLNVRHSDDRRSTFDAQLFDPMGRTALTVEGFTKVPFGASTQERRPAGAPDAPSGVADAVGITSGITVDEGVTTLLRLLTESTPANVAVVPAAEWPPAGSVHPDGAESAAPPRIEQAVVTGLTGPAPSVPVAASPAEPARSVEAGVEASTLAAIWAETLGVPEIGHGADFFELGGDSLTAVQLAGRIQERSGVAVSVTDLFENPTVEGLAATIRGRAPLRGTGR